MKSASTNTAHNRVVCCWAVRRTASLHCAVNTCFTVRLPRQRQARRRTCHFSPLPTASVEQTVWLMAVIIQIDFSCVSAIRSSHMPWQPPTLRPLFSDSSLIITGRKSERLLPAAGWLLLHSTDSFIYCKCCAWNGRKYRNWSRDSLIYRPLKISAKERRRFVVFSFFSARRRPRRSTPVLCADCSQSTPTVSWSGS